MSTPVHADNEEGIAYPLLRMAKDTRVCELTVYLTTGTRLTGKMHVSMSTSSAMRPSDAIRTTEGGFLLLSDVTLTNDHETREQRAIMIRMDAITHIELPQQGWKNRGNGANAQRPSLGLLGPKN